MKTLEEVIAEHMKDPEFKKEWDALEPEYRRIREELRAESLRESHVEESRAEKNFVVGYAI